MAVIIALVVTWLLFGALVGVWEARRGHWAAGWVLLAPAGPFAVPVAVAARRREREVAAPMPVTRGRLRHGPVDVLVGVDGSPASLEAGVVAATLLGSRVHSVTLAAVLDFDTATPHEDSAFHPQPWPEEKAARAALEAAAQELSARTGVTADTVVLAGNPADTLESYAGERGCDVIVAGCRGHGLSKLVFGSCASRLACKTDVPVLLVPTGKGEAVEPGLDAPADAR